MQQLTALHRYVTITYPVISLMAYTGDDIEQVSPVTSTLIRGVSIKLKLSNGGPIVKQKDQYLSDTNPTTSLCTNVLCLYLHAAWFG